LPERVTAGATASGARLAQTSWSLRWKRSTSAGENLTDTSSFSLAAMVPVAGETAKGASEGGSLSGEPSIIVTFHL